MALSRGTIALPSGASISMFCTLEGIKQAMCFGDWAIMEARLENRTDEENRAATRRMGNELRERFGDANVLECTGRGDGLPPVTVFIAVGDLDDLRDVALRYEQRSVITAYGSVFAVCRCVRLWRDTTKPIATGDALKKMGGWTECCGFAWAMTLAIPPRP